MATDFSTYARELRQSLNDAFDGELARILGETAQPASSGYAALFGGGKRIRGALVCLICDTLGGSRDHALPRAVAVELVQLATLIHDDFVDQHRQRRNRPALWTLTGARRAVLVGDIIFASAIRMMSERGTTDCRAISRAIADLSRGAFHEPTTPQALMAEIRQGRFDASLYGEVIRLKTGILFGVACELGAAAAGVGDEPRRTCRRYGMRVGEAYQIADDIHDIVDMQEKDAVTAAEMTALAPALLHFVPGSMPVVTAVLRGGTDLPAELRETLREAVERMREEKGRRLAEAVTETAGMPMDEDCRRLVRRAPADIIGMLDAEPRASAP